MTTLASPDTDPDRPKTALVTANGNATGTDPAKAVLYRTVMPQHQCPHGLKAKALLQREGFKVDDRWLESRAQIDALKAEIVKLCAEEGVDYADSTHPGPHMLNVA